MGLKFNPLTAQFDLTGSGGGGASYIDGEVATYNDLPLDGTAALNSAWLVRNASGVWPVSRKQAGIYIRTATAGSSRDADYTYAGTMPDVFSDAQFTLYDDADTSKNLKFQLSGLATGTTSTLTVPASGTIARLSDIPAAFDPASPGTIGGTTPAAATFTNLTANTRVNLPNTNGTTAGDIYRNANTLRYRDSTNTERMLLNATDNLANLASASTARTNLGLGSSDAVTFGSIQNTPIGSTSASSGAFTTLSASTSLTLGASGILSGGTNTIEQRNTTSAQTFRLYNTVSGAADADLERLFLRWSTNIAQIGTERTGTGSARSLELSVNGNRRFFIGTDGGVGIGSTTGLLASNGLYVDVPANSSSLTSPTVTIRGSTSVTLDNGGSPILRVASSRVMFGGTTSSFPALKQSSTTLQVRLADDSAFAPLECAGLTLNGNLTASTRNIVTDTTTGTRIGTGTTQLLAFWNATPAAQPAAVADATDAATVITQLNALLSRLRTIGIIAT